MSARPGKRKKKFKKYEDGREPESSHSQTPDLTDTDLEDETDKFQPYKQRNYTRKYPENCKRTDFVVFLTHKDDKKPFNDYDRLAISQGIRKHCVSGVLHLRPVNRFKIAITFDLSNNANVFLQNKKFHDELFLIPTIPASDTEVTGVLTLVPISLSNKKISTLIGSSKNVIQVRRFMRKMRGEDGIVVFQPTQTVAVTFASTQLPEYVYLDSWRHEVKPYIPPVKQCLRCMRFGHLAKFCKNKEVCSICSGEHNFKTCTIDNSSAKCANCSGNHIAISATCPLKKQKLEENKIKTKSVRYLDLFNEREFPQLTSKSIDIQIQNLTKSDFFINFLVETIIKITSNKDTPINNSSIREALRNTMNKKLSPLK